MGDNDSVFSLKRRWLADVTWEIGGTRIAVGELLEAGGPGRGVVVLPWALDEYERVLGLTVGETWLVKRLLRHCWQGTQCNPSFRAIERRSGVPRQTLFRWRDSLARKGYLEVGEPDSRGRRILDLRNLLCALAIAIAADPRSRWAAQNGGPLPLEAARDLRGFGLKRFNLRLHLLYDPAHTAGEEGVEEPAAAEIAW